MKTRIASLILVLSFTAAFAEPAGKPQYGAWGFDTEGADLKTKPGDDFFRYANGAWLDRVQIPADKPAYSLRIAMTDLTEQRLHDLMEENAKKAEAKPTTIEGKVGAFYKSYMDEVRIEKAGASPLKDKLAEIQSAKTREALAALMGRQNVDFHGGIFGVGIDVDIKDPKHYTVYLG
jgi:putative endopeptidase